MLGFSFSFLLCSFSFLFLNSTRKRYFFISFSALTFFRSDSIYILSFKGSLDLAILAIYFRYWFYLSEICICFSTSNFAFYSLPCLDSSDFHSLTYIPGLHHRCNRVKDRAIRWTVEKEKGSSSIGYIWMLWVICFAREFSRILRKKFLKVVKIEEKKAKIHKCPSNDHPLNRRQIR